MKRTKQPVKVYERKSADGLITFYHHVTIHGHRTKERLEALGRHKPNSRSYLKAKRQAEESALVRSADIFRGEYGLVDNRGNQPFMELVEQHCVNKARAQNRIRVAREFWGKTRLGQVTPRKVEEYKAYLMNRYAPKSAFEMFTITCKAVLRYAFEEGWLRTDPARRVQNPPNVAINKSPLLTLEEAQLWLSWTPKARTKRCGLEEMTMLHKASSFMLHTGLLWAETKEVTFGQIKCGVLEMVRCKNRTKASAKSFVIRLPEEVQQLVGDGPDTAQVFPIAFGQHFMTDGLRFIAADLGINKKVNVRTFRHTLLTQLALNGAGAHAIQSVAGHSRITMSQEYVRRTEQMQAQHLHNVYQR